MWFWSKYFCIFFCQLHDIFMLCKSLLVSHSWLWYFICINMSFISKSRALLQWTQLASMQSMMHDWCTSDCSRSVSSGLGAGKPDSCLIDFVFWQEIDLYFSIFMLIFPNICCIETILNNQCKSYVFSLHQTETETEKDRQGDKRFVYSFRKFVLSPSLAINPRFRIRSSESPFLQSTINSLDNSLEVINVLDQRNQRVKYWID